MAKTNTPKTPTHEIFHVVGEKDRARWTKIGAGWEHGNGDGLNLVINYTPLIAGRMVARRIKTQEADA